MVALKDIKKFFSGKKVFITGHTGFKGSWLTYLLDHVGAKTLGYSLQPNTNPSLYANLKFSNLHDSLYSDVNNYRNLKKEIRSFKPDFIFHLAAQPLVLESYKNPMNTFKTNFNGTLNILETLRDIENECVSIFVTTDKVYENNGSEISFLESDPLGGRDPYSASKAASEILIHSYNDSYFKNTNIKIASVRSGNVIGGGDWSANRLIPDIIKSVKESKTLLIRNPKSTRPWQHVFEPIIGYLMLAIKLSKNPIKQSESWNFGPELDDNKTVQEIIDLFITEGLKININYHNEKKYEAKFLSLNINKSKKFLNWKPKWKSEFAVKKTIGWYMRFYDGLSPNDLMINDIQTFLN